MTPRRLVLAAPIVLAGFALSAAGPAASPYRFVTYDAPGWQNTQLYGITNQGMLTGGAYTADGTKYTGLVWLASGLRFVNVPGQGPRGTFLYQANQHGHVAGNYYDDAGLAHAIIYQVDRDTFERIPDYPGATLNAAGGIADDGVAAGNFTFDPNVEVNFVAWLYADGTYHNFVAPKSDQALDGTITYALNNALTVVGSYADAKGLSHGYYKTLRGPVVQKDVPVAGATGTQLYGINNADAVAGQYTDAQGLTHGFVQHGDRFVTVDYPGAALTQVLAINDAGDIAGSYNDAAGNQHGFVGWVR